MQHTGVAAVAGSAFGESECVVSASPLPDQIAIHAGRVGRVLHLDGGVKRDLREELRLRAGNQGPADVVECAALGCRQLGNGRGHHRDDLATISRS